MKKKNVLSAALAAVLVISMALAGCGKKDTQQESKESTPASKTEQVKESEKDTTESSAEDSSIDVSSLEPYEIKIFRPGTGTTENIEAVSKALSELTLRDMNATVSIQMVSMGTYVQQLNLLLASGEELDLFYPSSLSPNTLVSNGQILPLNDLLDQYGKETKAAISDEDWACCTFDGEIYLIPCNEDKAVNIGFEMRKDIADEVGFDYTQDRDYTLDELYDLFVKVKAAHPEMYPVGSNMGDTWSRLPVDNLGDNLGVITDPYGTSTTVENLYETEYFKGIVEYMYKLAQEGLLIPDASTNTESRESLIKSGKAFGGFAHMKPGFAEEKGRNAGYELVTVEISPAFSMTEHVSQGAYAIASTSGDPERAMMFANKAYNDPEYANLLVNGLEGTNYEFTDDTKTVIKLPEGADSAAYSRSAFLHLNQGITYIWNGDPLDLWEQFDEFNANAKASPAKGFTFNNANVLNEIAACKNVVDKYKQALLAGSMEPEENIAKFNEELKANGMDKIIAEKQKQLDEWLKNK